MPPPIGLPASSIVDAISFIRRIDLWSENKFSQNSAPVPAEFEFEFLNPAIFGFGRIWNSQMRYRHNPSMRVHVI